MKKFVLFLPLALLVGMVLFLVIQLKHSENVLPSEDWRGKPFPEFQLPNLLNQTETLSKASLPNEPFLVNVWASWCSWCIKEFPQLLELQKQGVKIVGLTYVDKPADARAALEKWGNPFITVIDDSQHDFLINTLKIRSAPQMYLVDHQGIIRYQHIGYDPNFDLIKEFQSRLELLGKEVQ